jgi:hypothetical protein
VEVKKKLSVDQHINNEKVIKQNTVEVKKKLSVQELLEKRKRFY